MSKAAVRTCMSVVLLLALSACSGASPDQPGSTPTVAADAAAPPTENTTAVEQPLPPQEGKPGISVATLPIGGNDQGLDPCVQVSWSGGDIPQGYGAEINGVGFEPDAYQQSDASCPGSPCMGHVFRANELQCDLAIRPSDASKTDRSGNEQVKVFMDGRVLCPDYSAAACTDFAESVRKQSSSMTLALPISPEAPPPEAPPTSDGSNESNAPTNTESSGG